MQTHNLLSNLSPIFSISLINSIKQEHEYFIYHMTLKRLFNRVFVFWRGAIWHESAKILLNIRYFILAAIT